MGKFLFKIDLRIWELQSEVRKPYQVVVVDVLQVGSHIFYFR